MPACVAIGTLVSMLYRDKAFNTKQKLAFATQGVEITKEPFE